MFPFKQLGSNSEAMRNVIWGFVIPISIFGMYYINRPPTSPIDSNSSHQKDQHALEALQTRMRKVKDKCGLICETVKSKTAVIGHGWYDVIRKPFSCENMFKYDFFDTQSEFENASRTIPTFLFDEFTYQGRVHVSYRYSDEKKVTVKNILWPTSLVEKFLEKTRSNMSICWYGQEAYLSVKSGLRKANVSGTHVLVIGSQRPWVEAMLLEQGASHVTTLEYSIIECDHPQITTYTPQQLTSAFLDGTLPVFDGVVSYSSMEHSGLGRYGDGLNPYGDLIAMARAWCLVKDHGFAIVGVPTGPDHITFNLHRVYGPVMYSHLFANWQQVYTDTNINLYTSDAHRKKIFAGGHYQTLHVLRKNRTMFGL